MQAIRVHRLGGPQKAARHGVRALFFLVGVSSRRLEQIAALIEAGELTRLSASHDLSTFLPYTSDPGETNAKVQQGS